MTKGQQVITALLSITIVLLAINLFTGPAIAQSSRDHEQPYVVEMKILQDEFVEDEGVTDFLFRVWSDGRMEVNDASDFTGRNHRQKFTGWKIVD